MSDQTWGKAARKAWDEMQLRPDAAGNAEPGEYVCGDCDRIERDPIFLDLEQCSQCSEYITAVSDELPNCVWANAETPFAKNH